MSAAFTVQQIEKFTVVEFVLDSLMDPIVLDKAGAELYRLIEQEDHRRIILDFERVQYVSSQAIGIVMAMRKKLTALKGSKLVLCSLYDKLVQLVKLTGLEKLLTIKPTQREALKVWE